MIKTPFNVLDLGQVWTNVAAQAASSRKASGWGYGAAANPLVVNTAIVAVVRPVAQSQPCQTTYVPAYAAGSTLSNSSLNRQAGSSAITVTSASRGTSGNTALSAQQQAPPTITSGANSIANSFANFWTSQAEHY